MEAIAAKRVVGGARHLDRTPSRLIGLLLLLCCATTGTAFANVDCDLGTLQNAVNSAGRGATVECKPGSWTWTGTLTLSRGISVLGAGSGGTTITSTGLMVRIAPDASALSNDEVIRIEGFTFDGSNSTANFIHVQGAGGGSSKPFRNLVIGNNRFQNASAYGDGVIFTSGQVRGVIYGNTFDRINVLLRSFGNDITSEWESGVFPLAYGTADSLYFEDNTITFSSSFGGGDPGWIETGQGSRLVARFNTWNMANAQTQAELWDIHGFQNWTGAPNSGQTGTMLVEYYNNDIVNFRGYRWINHRGSWGMFFSNTAVASSGADSFQVNQYAEGCASLVSPTPGSYRPEVNNTYVFNNVGNGARISMRPGGIGNNCGISENNGYWNEVSAFNGTSGVGRGDLANRPSTCTKGVGYWAEDRGEWRAGNPGPDGQFYKCIATNTWALDYVPYVYPHPLASGASAPAIDTIPPTVTLTSPSGD